MKPHQQFPLRKSPRFSSTPPPPPPPSTRNSARSKPKSQPDDAWALSLHVADQVPLKISYPSDEGEGKSIRRSSRFTANKLKTTAPKTDNASDWGKLRRFTEDREAVSGRVRKKTKLGSEDVVILRRSYRLKGGKNGNSATQILALADPPSKSAEKCFLSEKCLRSRSVLMHKVEKVSSKESLAGMKCLPGPPLVKHAPVKSPDSSSGKWLRSRSLGVKVGNEKENEKSASKISNFGANGKTFRSEETEYSLIEFPEKSRNPRRGSSLRRHKDNAESPNPEKSAFPIEKRLRSRSVKMHTQKEMPETGGSMIELPENRSSRFLRRSNKDCGESSKTEKLASSPQLENESLEKDGYELHEKRLIMSPKIESVLDELFGDYEERDSEKCDSDVSNEKRLGSRKSKSKQNEDENSEKTASRVEGACGSKRKGSNDEENVNLKEMEKGVGSSFVGEPIPKEVAQERWQWRYELKSNKNGKSWKINADEEDEIILNVDCHYAQAKVGNCVLDIGDCVYVKGEGTKKHIGRILEFFKTTQAEDYFRVQWFFRAEDTVMKDAASSHDKKRLFYSTLMNDNILDCIISKVNVVQILPTLCLKSKPMQSAAFYYDMEYSVEYSTFRTLVTEPSIERQSLLSNSKYPDDKAITTAPLAVLPNIESSELALLDLYSGCGGKENGACLGANFSSVNLVTEPSTESQSSSSNSKYPDDKSITIAPLAAFPSIESPEPELALLDLYSGCGGMSTGLCLGVKLSSVNLVTKWAVDFDSSACDSLRLNHPETHVRNESADYFLELLKQWEKLCKLYVSDLDRTLRTELEDPLEAEANTTQSDRGESSGEYEVLDVVDICFGDPNNSGKCGLHFKVRWKGYGPDDDTWEPVEGLSNCQERIQEFVLKGFKSKFLPLPGDADVICGGPPCQGISGYNRFRNFDSPLSDERNRQIIVFMDIVEFLKPRYVLMENVVDIIKFDKGSLGRYALSRLVRMKYQARLGTMASGCYGLPQFRLRVFIWGAGPTEKLPQFPLPTHDVVVKNWPPLDFERNTVGYDEGQHRMLEEAIVLRDAISDLQLVANGENREEMDYLNPPRTEFQRFIRLSKDEMMGGLRSNNMKFSVLYDHRPLQLSEHDYFRVRQIPRRKGANFRDLPGIIAGEDNVAHRDPSMETVMITPGKPIVPDCVLNFEKGKSRKPYGRLWWDETLSTLVTFPNIRVQAILHPEQDRLLTIRECARLQGFPDYYRFCGTIKERYRQVGNAVSVPVARALGFALGMAYRKVTGDEPLMTLPAKFSSLLPPVVESV